MHVTLVNPTLGRTAHGERFGVYCAYNPLFRRESFKKQGLRLGTR